MREITTVVESHGENASHGQGGTSSSGLNGQVPQGFTVLLARNLLA